MTKLRGLNQDVIDINLPDKDMTYSRYLEIDSPNLAFQSLCN